MKLENRARASFSVSGAKKILENYHCLHTNKAYGIGTEFYSSFNPDLIYGSFVNYLQERKVMHSVSKKKYKLKITESGINNSGQDYQVTICMRILKVNN